MSWKARRFGTALAWAMLLSALPAAAAAQEKTTEPKPNEGGLILRRAAEHMLELSMQLAEGEGKVERWERPLLTFGDSARANQNGTLWAFGRAGRPLAMLELYQGVEPNARWIHAVTLTGTQRVRMKNPTGTAWSPEKSQVEPSLLSGVADPDEKEPARLRQMKELARRFSAHEFWDPGNSRFELRLLVSPVLRYAEPTAQLQDGAAFVLAHGTNPEVVLLIEAIGKNIEESRWHFCLARLGSAEMHVALDGKEVWSVERTPGVVGQPADPYWLFSSVAEPAE